MKKSLKLLLVEDNPGDADLVREFLSDKKILFEIETVSRLSEAINRINDDKFDVILLDLGLPDSSGLQTIKSFRKVSKNIPIVVQTGNNDERTGLGAIQEGAQDYVIKNEVNEELLYRVLSYAVERHQNNEKLMDSEQSLATLMNSVEIGIVVIDSETRKIKIANPYLCNILREKKENVEGQPCEKLICSLGSGICPILDLHKDKDKTEMELTQADGTELVFMRTVSKIFISGKEHLLGVFVDISDRKKTEEDNRKLLANVQHNEKLESLGVLAGGIAHDFNNLLSGIFGFIEMAKVHSENNCNVTKYLDKSLSVLNRAKDLTQQLLTFAKGGSPERKTGQLSFFIQQSCSFILAGSDIACEYDLPKDMYLCDFDENQICQVIDNIVINARQSMPSGGKIVVSGKNISVCDDEIPELKKGNYVRISITDSGTGIPQNIIKKIFDPFFTTKQKGSGLGLASSYSIIKKHEGTIEVESEPGVGTTFHIFLPASEKECSEPDAVHHEESNATGVVLVMDDEDFVREIIRDMLETKGYSVLAVPDGDSAAALFRQAAKEKRKIDAAILDLTVPGGLGGKETAPLINEISPDVPIFASSGYSEDPVISNPRAFGFTDSIKKPFKFEELIGLLNKHLKNRN